MKWPVLNIFARSLTAKLVFFFLLITITPLIISSYVSYNSTNNTLQAEYIRTNLKVMQQGAQNIDNYLEVLHQITLSPYKDNDFMLALITGQSGFLKRSYNESFLKNILFSRDDLTYLYFYTIPNHTLYSFSKELAAKHVYPALETEPWFVKTLRRSNGFYFYPTHHFINYRKIGSLNHQSRVFTMNRVIKDIATNKVLGILTLNIDIKQLGLMCRRLLNDHEKIILTDNRANLIYSTASHPELGKLVNPKLIGQRRSGFYIAKAGVKKYIVIFSRTFQDFILLKAVPYEFLVSSSQRPVKIIFGVGLVLMIIVVFLAGLISYEITFPIKQLVKKMNELSQGNFTIQAATRSNDEIGLLTRRFNEMALKINDLINSEYKAKITAQGAQLQALQAQINPHFLNNALQSLGTLALRKGAQDVYAMALAIASMLRYSLQSTADLVSLQTETEYTRNYLSIQKIRFGTRLEYQFALGEDIRDFKVPRLILQPLVENSIKYGIDDSQNQAEIRITGWCEARGLVLEITDTGPGIPPQRLSEILARLRQDQVPPQGEHLGLRNVSDRLRLVYHDQAGLEITSQPGKGTTVTLRIPQTNQNG